MFSSRDWWQSQKENVCENHVFECKGWILQWIRTVKVFITCTCTICAYRIEMLKYAASSGNSTSWHCKISAGIKVLYSFNTLHMHDAARRVASKMLSSGMELGCALTFFCLTAKEIAASKHNILYSLTPDKCNCFEAWLMHSELLVVTWSEYHPTSDRLINVHCFV